MRQVGVDDPNPWLSCANNPEEASHTTVLQWSYAPESMWRGSHTPRDITVVKLAKAMVAVGFRKDPAGSGLPSRGPEEHEKEQKKGLPLG